MKTYENSELEKVVILAKSMGYKVWTFETSSNMISQVFIDDGTTYGSVSAYFSGVRYSTCHKPGPRCGTGFGIGQSLSIKNANKESIDRTLGYAPDWAWSLARENKIEKESFEWHIKRNSILEYYEL